jgi:hypothetical protein
MNNGPLFFKLYSPRSLFVNSKQLFGYLTLHIFLGFSEKKTQDEKDLGERENGSMHHS